MNDEQRAMAVNGALNGQGIQLALPQTIQPVTKTQYQVQRTQYDPEKLLALKTALATPRRTMSRDEIWANALANYPEAKSYTGGFGEEIISPWAEGVSSFMRSFGSAYAAAKADEREKAEQAREDAIKAAQLDYEASKQNISDQTATDYIKYNDPNAKGMQAQAEKMTAMAQLDMLEKQLEDIGTRYDDDYADIDDMEKRLTKADTERVDALWGFGTTAKERKARNELDAWTGNIKNILVNANRQAGSGNMSDADAARYEQGIAQAKTLPQKREILRAFKARMNASPVQNMQQTKQSQISALPQKGQIVDGYEFLGGDPADAKNWRVK